MDRSDEKQLKQAATRLVALAAEGKLGSKLSEPLATLTPAIGDAVGQVYGSWRKHGSSSYLEKDDLVQDVLVRLAEKPPSRPRQRNPLVAVLAWAKTVACHMLQDAHRRETVRGNEEHRVPRARSLERNTPGDEKREPDPRVEAALVENRSDALGRAHDREHAAYELDRCEEQLKKTYPRGAEYVRLCREHGTDLSGQEYSRLMGVSTANLYQIVKRTKVVLSDFAERERLTR